MESCRWYRIVDRIVENANKQTWIIFVVMWVDYVRFNMTAADVPSRELEILI